MVEADVVVMEVGDHSQRWAKQKAQPHQTVAIVSLEIVSQENCNQELQREDSVCQGKSEKP